MDHAMTWAGLMRLCARRIGAGLLGLQPLKQLARRTPWLGLEPAVQLLGHCCKRVRTPPQPFGLLFRSCRRPHLALLPRGPQPGEELLKRWLLDRGHCLRRIGDLDKPLLHCPNVTEQAHRIELGALRFNLAFYLFRRPRVGHQPLIWRGWLPMRSIGTEQLVVAMKVL